MPSSTPSNFRCCSCNIFTARTFAFFRFCAGPSCAAFIKAASRKATSTCSVSSIALGNLSAREGNKLFWVLGVDMAHMGRRYGDQMIARAEEGEMAAVAERDKRRIERLTAVRSAGLLGSDPGESGRSEMVRFVAHVYVPEGGSAGPRDVAALPAVEHRRAERG